MARPSGLITIAAPEVLVGATPRRRSQAAIMQAHVAYCGKLLQAGKAIVFGPVADPLGVWGLGVLQLPDDADPQAIVADDPVMKANVGFTYQVMPMLQAATRENCAP